MFWTTNLESSIHMYLPLQCKIMHFTLALYDKIKDIPTSTKFRQHSLSSSMKQTQKQKMLSRFTKDTENV